MKRLLLVLLVVIEVQCHYEYTLPLLGHGDQGETYEVQVLYQVVDQTGGVPGTLLSYQPGAWRSTLAQCQYEYTLPLLGHGDQGETYEVQVLYQVVDQTGGGGTLTTDTGHPIVIPAGGAEIYPFTVNETDLPAQSQLKNKTFTLVASGTPRVNLQVITSVNGYSEGYQALPNPKLGTEYYVSTFCALGGYCQVVIGSTAVGATQVYVQLPSEVDEIGFCIKNGTWYSKSDTTITLIYPEVVQLETTHDLTGTRIYSDNPVAVISGSRTSTGSTPMYHLAEQLIPVPEWGTVFYVRPIGTNAYGNIVHITSRYRKTFVTMDGFRTVELTGYGQTVKRRIVLGSAVKIKSSEPVQVMLYTGFTYASNETIVNPGMTLVPAFVHFRSSTRFICHSQTPGDIIQVIRFAPTIPTVTGSFGTSSSSRVAYTEYLFEEYIQAITSSPPMALSNGIVSGIITCNVTAIFPIGTPIRPFPALFPFCLGLPRVMPNPMPDGVDNDCGNGIDEDVCYENRMFAAGTYSMFNNTFVGQRSHTENIADFTLIKFRLRSCGDAKIELVSGADKLVISIAKEVLTIYKCVAGVGCVTAVFSQTTSYTATADCQTLVPYWIYTYQSELCMGIGPFPDIQCSDPLSTVDVTGFIFTEMVMFGLHSNAVFYYDVYRGDCGGLKSDWRCTDMASNCWEYENDLCTTYADWAKINCRKFCGFCAPDSVGKMFVVIPPAGYPGMNINYYITASDEDESAFNSVSSKLNSAEFVPQNATTKDSGTITTMASSGSTTNLAFVYLVYTSSESHLTVTARNNVDAITIPVFPLDALGTEYMTLSFFPGTECSIASVERPSTVEVSTKTNYNFFPNVYPYIDVGLSVNEHVGTVISSTEPVSVFCYYPGGNPSDNYWSQLMPTSSWGTSYILPALNTSSPSTSFNGTARILATSANTWVEIFGDFQSVDLLPERGNYLDKPINPNVTYTIKSNFPIGIAVLYVETFSGAKSMITIPPVDNYMDSPAIFSNDLPGSAYFSVADVAGNGTALTPESAEAYNTSSLFYKADTPASLAMSIVNDFSAPQANVEVYNHPVHMSGHLVKDLQTARICTVTMGTAGDGVDNDCDGEVDEETSCFTGYGHYNSDLDLDANFGEDCLGSTGANAASPPAIPVCYRLIFPTNNTQHCYTPCACPCDWIDELSGYNNMTKDEKDASNFEKIKPYILLLQIDKTILSTKVAEKESAEDSRTSSANIGMVGIAMLTFICCLIGIFDFINVVRYFKNLRKPVGNIMQGTD